MELRVRKHADIFILDIHGELDLYNTSNIKDAFQRMVEKQAKKFIINLDNVTYLDSSGLGSLIQIHHQAELNSFHLVFCNIHSQTRKVFELTRLSKFFLQERSIDDAIAYLQGL